SIADKAQELAPNFTGRLLQPADAGYDDARRVHNGHVDKRPPLIARCQSTSDVAVAVKHALRIILERALRAAFRNGGVRRHNVGSRGTIAGQMMTDVALRRGMHVPM